MNTYTPTNPSYSPSVPIVESTDVVNAENNNMPVKALMDNIAWLKENAGIQEFIEVPVPDDTAFDYDGTEKDLVFTGLDTTKVTVGGTTSATAAGVYICTLTLASPQYMWKDLTSGVKEIEWAIQVDGSVTLSANAVALNDSALSATVTVTNATGEVSVSSSDSSVATASISGNTITIASPDGETNGSTTVTVNVATNGKYKAVTKSISVTVKFATIYGASWDGTSTTAWSRTDAAESFTDPVPYVSGASSYNSPFDDILPWSGMVKEERTGGTMVKIPKFWYKITQNGAGMKVQIADGAKPGFSVSPAHMDRGDGNGERDYIYVGRYHCGSSAYKSVTGQTPKANVTRSAARTAIHNLGSNLWQIDFATRFTLWLLYIVEFANWNSQDKIGRGCGNNSSAQAMGYTDSMPYHTGTTQSSRTTYGLGTQYRYIEGLWDNVYDWLDGCYYNSSGLNIILNPSKFSDSSNGKSVGTPSSGYPSAFSVKDVADTFEIFIPTAANGSDSTYSCDNWDFGSSNPCLFAGGGYGRGLDRGLFFVSCTGASNSGASLGCRLLELP